jgi:hypothetical protein
MNKGMNHLWPTKVLYDSVGNRELLNNVVQEIISTYDLSAPPSDFNNNGLFEDCGIFLNQFKEEIVIPAFEKYLREAHDSSLSEYKRYNLKSWITGSGHGYNMLYHNHSGAAFSAVFYLLAEDAQKGGDIVFSDPRHNANRGYDSKLKTEFENVFHTPSTGDIVIFPSFLYHYVNPYYSNLRIAMPVDLFLYYD